MNSQSMAIVMLLLQFQLSSSSSVSDDMLKKHANKKFKILLSGIEVVENKGNATKDLVYKIKCGSYECDIATQYCDTVISGGVCRDCSNVCHKKRTTGENRQTVNCEQNCKVFLSNQGTLPVHSVITTEPNTNVIQPSEFDVYNKLGITVLIIIIIILLVIILLLVVLKFPKWFKKISEAFSQCSNKDTEETSVMGLERTNFQNDRNNGDTPSAEVGGETFVNGSCLRTTKLATINERDETMPVSRNTNARPNLSEMQLMQSASEITEEEITSNDRKIPITQDSQPASPQDAYHSITNNHEPNGNRIASPEDTSVDNRSMFMRQNQRFSRMGNTTSDEEEYRHNEMPQEEPSLFTGVTGSSGVGVDSRSPLLLN